MTSGSHDAGRNDTRQLLLAAGILIFAWVGVPGLLYGSIWVIHEWWMSAHCTMVLGTQVCR